MDNEIFFFQRINNIISKGVKLARTIYSGKLIIDYVAIFSESDKDYKELHSFLVKKGKIVEKTSTGNTFLLSSPYKTPYGFLNLIKIRKYDSNKPYLGAPDFKVDYIKFKKNYGKFCNLIKRENYEMLELAGKEVLVYFPSKTLSEELDI